MGDEKQRYEHLPIPTYEEATSSRPQSSDSRLGPNEISDDAERQGLLRSNYAAPTVESNRSSLDSLDGIEVESEAELRRDILQMDIEDPLNDRSSSRSSILSNQFKRFTSFTTSLQSLTLPSFSRFIPSLPFSFPSIDWQTLDSNRVVIFGRLVGIVILGGLMYTLIASDIITFGNKRNMFMFRPDQVRNFVLENINAHSKAQEYLQRITEYPHMAGTEGNYVLGEWVFELFKQGGLEDVTMERFDVYLNYPQKDGRRVAIVDPPELAWEAQIEEDSEATYVFHGHSASGNVVGPLVYANFGSPQDFERLQELGISVKGAVVLVRYYGSQGDRALKVKAAELAGAVGCIIYSDPAQDGYLQGPTFPDGRFMPPNGVQRGAVSLMSWVVGDVLSPGYASTPGEKRRLDIDDSEGLNKIPSIPLSWNDARHLLDSLQGHGTKLDGHWVGVPDVEYWTGDTSSPHVNLKNIQDEETHQPIYNVLGRIIGWEQPTRKIIVGNHRDAWCSGAADPGSGTVILLEVIRNLGELQNTGWKPLRTIEFANWDGEEYNLIGSTEHVENRWHELHETGIAYINLDTAVTGIDLRASASPMLHKAFMHAIERIEDPASNQTMHDIWLNENKRFEGLGAGSDYVAFQDLVGMSSIDLSFQGAEFPYHSCYDSYEWMTQYGDPDFSYHRTMAKIISLLILELSDHALLPLDIEAFATSLHQYIDTLDKDVNTASSKPHPHLDLTPLRHSADLLSAMASIYTEFDNAWHSLIFSSGGFESSIMGLKRIDRNENLANFESYLLDMEGLVNRTQFKHVIFGPQKWSGYDEAFFPGIRDYAAVGDWDKAQREVGKVGAILERAVRSLHMG